MPLLINNGFLSLGSYQGGWISQYGDVNQWLMIDLGKVSKVTRIATQGRSDAGWWSKSYSLDYTTEDGGEFTKYNNGEVCLHSLLDYSAPNG